jgi:hypothetical protein
MTWRVIDTGTFAPILSSGRTFELERSRWPLWATGNQWQRFFAYALAADEKAPSVQTTRMVVARILSERYDRKDAEPYNYNWYWVVQGLDGCLYQSGPHRDVNFGHWLATPISADLLRASSRLS